MTLAWFIDANLPMAIRVLFREVDQSARVHPIPFHSTSLNSCKFFCFLWIHIKSLWPSDAIWQHRSGTMLAQVMACCLTAPSHYLNQCVWVNVACSSVRFCCIHLRAISRSVPKLLSYIDRLVQERPNSIANALELRLPCTNPSSLQNKCRTADIERQNLGRSGKLSFFIIYKYI